MPAFSVSVIYVDTENIHLKIDVMFNRDYIISIVEVIMEVEIFLLYIS